jgi:putative membrane protein
LAWKSLFRYSGNSLQHDVQHPLDIIIASNHKENPMFLLRTLALTALLIPLSFMQAADTVMLHENDQAFIKNATIGGMSEIMMSEAALKRTLTADEKTFTQQLITDHAKVNNELAAIAKKKGVSPPASVPADEQEKMTKMSAVKDKDFNETYLEHQISCHKKAIDLFEDQADDGKDAELKEFASKTLPQLKMHLEMAKRLEAKY